MALSLVSFLSTVNVEYTVNLHAITCMEKFSNNTVAIHLATGQKITVSYPVAAGIGNLWTAQAENHVTL